jgi:hypothetical protein
LPVPLPADESSLLLFGLTASALQAMSSVAKTASSKPGFAITWLDWTSGKQPPRLVDAVALADGPHRPSAVSFRRDAYLTSRHSPGYPFDVRRAPRLFSVASLVWLLLVARHVPLRSYRGDSSHHRGDSSYHHGESSYHRGDSSYQRPRY